jgi:hypothetical protein
MAFAPPKRLTEMRYAGWAAFFSGIAAILGLVSLILFFSLESTPNSGQTPHFWGPISDIAPIIQMVSLLVVAFVIYRMQRSRTPGLSMMSGAIGVIGMLGVALLQFLLIFKVISFEREVGLVLLATAAVGVWLFFVNFLGRRQGSLPSRLAWLGIAVGVAFVLEPVMLSAAGGAVAWRVFMSNYLLLAGSAVVFLVSYVGFPVWAFWLGRVFLRGNGTGEHTISQNSVQSDVVTSNLIEGDSK